MGMGLGLWALCWGWVSTVGFTQPTSGTADVEGFDIRTDMDRIYSLMGVCPQAKNPAPPRPQQLMLFILAMCICQLQPLLPSTCTCSPG
jgi:hypothetical protein